MAKASGWMDDAMEGKQMGRAAMATAADRTVKVMVTATATAMEMSKVTER